MSVKNKVKLLKFYYPNIITSHNFILFFPEQKAIYDSRVRFLLPSHQLPSKRVQKPTDYKKSPAVGGRKITHAT